MVKFLPFENGVHNEYYSFAVTLHNPCGDEDFKCVIYSYVEDIAIVAAIVEASTKYKFTIADKDAATYLHYRNEWSINQACQYLKRLRFYKKEVVTKTKTITWDEEIETEL